MITKINEFRKFLEGKNSLSDKLYNYVLTNIADEGRTTGVDGIPFKTEIGAIVEYQNSMYKVTMIGDGTGRDLEPANPSYNYHLCDDGGCSTEWDVPFKMRKGDRLVHEYGTFKVTSYEELINVMCNKID